MNPGSDDNIFETSKRSRPAATGLTGKSQRTKLVSLSSSDEFEEGKEGPTHLKS